MTQIAERAHDFDNDPQDGDVAAATLDEQPTRSRARQFARDYRLPLGVSGVALVVGIAAGFVQARFFEGGDAVAASPNTGGASAPLVPATPGNGAPTGQAGNPNIVTSPTPSSGGFNNAAGQVALQCTGLSFRHVSGGFEVTPQVEGGGNDALYTVLVSNNGSFHARMGVGPILANPSGHDEVYPSIYVIDGTGTDVTADNYQSKLDGPLADVVPDDHIADCPTTPYPAG